MIGNRRLLGWLIIVVAFPFWIMAISGASGHGFFENELAVQLMVLGGAVSMIGGLFLFYD